MSRTLARAVARPLTLMGGVALMLTAWAGTSDAASSSKTTTTTAASTTTSTVVSAADTWLLKAIGAEAKVGSVRVTANETSGKAKQQISLLVNGDGEGSDLVQSGSTIKISLVGPILYFNAPKAYWAAHASAAQAKAYGGKWIEVSALDSRFQAFDEFFNPEDLVAAVFQGHSVPLQLAHPKGTFMGHKYVIVSEKVTTKGKTSSGQMYIASTGLPRALKIVDTSPGMTTTILFTKYGKAVSITTPPKPINLT